MILKHNKELPKNRKKGIIIVADSTFLITAGSTKGQKDKQGKWHFTDESVAFSGKGHHKHDIYELFEIIPVIIRKKMVYPKGFSHDGYPLCPFGFKMRPRGI